MASAWNMFVKKIYWEGKKKNKGFQFKDALKEASRRKGEMGSMKSTGSMKKSSKKSKKMRGRKSMSMGMMGGKRSRKRSRKMRGGTGNAPSSSFAKNASDLSGGDSNNVQFRAGNAA
jgi:hypothetical protein